MKRKLPSFVSPGSSFSSKVTNLSCSDIERYSRQMLLPSFGVKAQEALKASSILMVGAGGLGSSAAMYLVAAGVGKLTIIDNDRVDVSNLHRQVIHTVDAAKHKRPKVESAAQFLTKLNDLVEIKSIHSRITPENVIDLVKSHTLVVDASDNQETRYLLNDACVLCGKTLVSGAAVSTNGQLTVYNAPLPAQASPLPTKLTKSTTNTSTTDAAKLMNKYKVERGPCLRCLFAYPPTSAGSGSCSDSGVLGMLPGLIGVMQALEAIKLITNIGTALISRMLIVDGLDMRVRTIRLRPRNPKCIVCSSTKTITSIKDSVNCLGKTANLLAISERDTDECGRDTCPFVAQNREKVEACIEVPSSHRIPAQRLKEWLDHGEYSSESKGPSDAAANSSPSDIAANSSPSDVAVNSSPSDIAANSSPSDVAVNSSGVKEVKIVDVRDVQQYRMCCIPGSINIPLTQLKKDLEDGKEIVSKDEKVVVICRRGVASLRATHFLLKHGYNNVYNLDGGLQQWAKTAEFPYY